MARIRYRGHEIDCHRSCGLLYYSITDLETGEEWASDFSSGSDKIDDFIKYLKGWVDDYLLENKE